MDVGVREIRNWHLRRGWLDVGYHYVIRRDGTLEKGRDDETIGSHCKGLNNSSIGVCLIGGIDADGRPEANFTQEQMDTLKGVIESLRERYGEIPVKGHHSFANKACPSFNVHKWLTEGVLETSVVG